MYLEMLITLSQKLEEENPAGLDVSSFLTLARDLSVEDPICISEHPTFLCNILKMEGTHQTTWH